MILTSLAPGNHVNRCMYAFSILKGQEIRELKKAKPSKAELQPHIDVLVELKAKYQEVAGKPYAPPSNGSAAASAPAAKPAPKAQKQAPKKGKSPGVPKDKGAPRVAAGGKGERGLPSPPQPSGPLLDEDGKPNVEHLNQHLLGFSYVAG